MADPRELVHSSALVPRCSLCLPLSLLNVDRLRENVGNLSDAEIDAIANGRLNQGHRMADEAIRKYNRILAICKHCTDSPSRFLTTHIEGLLERSQSGLIETAIQKCLSPVRKRPPFVSA